MFSLLKAYGLLPWWSQTFSDQQRNRILAAIPEDTGARSASELLAALLTGALDAMAWKEALLIADKLESNAPLSPILQRARAEAERHLTTAPRGDNPFEQTPHRSETVPARFLASRIAELNDGERCHIALDDVLVDPSDHAFLCARAVAVSEETGLVVSYGPEGYTLTITRPVLLKRVASVGEELPVAWVVDRS